MLLKMIRNQRIITLAIAVASVSTIAYSQQQGTSPRDGAGRDRFQRGQFDPARMQEMMLQRFQRILEMEDDEWQVVSPLLGKVMQAQGRSRMRGMPFGRGGWPRGGRDGTQANRSPEGGRESQQRQQRQGRGGPFGGSGRGGFGPPASPEIVALNDALDNEDVPADEIRAKLKAVRSARKRQEAELKKAREELREVLTVRQEARLVSIGMLD